jgi:hypothetical protein
MSNIFKEGKEFEETFRIREDELAEAKANLFGLFELLYKIDQRLKEENELQ